MQPSQPPGILSFFGSLFSGGAKQSQSFFTPVELPQTASKSLSTAGANPNQASTDYFKPLATAGAKPEQATNLGEIRKTLYPTFEEQIQSVQNERRQSLLPEEAKKLAIAKDKEMLLVRGPQRNPKTG